MSETVSETLREIAPSATGSYSVLSLLKEGTHSRVFLAEKEGKRFVLKTPASDGAEDIELLRREWEMSIGLTHPGLSYVFTWEPSSPVGPCMVQEWVDGRSLTDYLTEKPSASSRKRVFGQLLEVVSYMHRKGVMHNDLSPTNILISRADDTVKIIDLGYADDDVHITLKSLGGTRGYASPELLNGGLVDARSDIWTLGALLRDIFPGRYRRIVRRCMRENPAHRYASVDALLRAWTGYWRPLWVAVFVLLACAIGALTWSDINVRSELDERKKVEAETADALSAAKAEVDVWYATAVPAFRQKLATASTAEEVNAAWLELVEKTSAINSDIPSRAPETVRAAVREYTIQLYYDTFPALQEEMASRLGTL